MRHTEPVRRLLANRPLAALVIAGAISGIGDWIYLTALPVLIYLRTEDPVLVGLAVIGRLIPYFLLSVPAGIAADRYPCRAILVASESIRGLAMLVVAILCATGADVAPMIVLTIVAAAAGTFSFPAQASLTPDLARDDAELGQANSVFATLDSLACVIGPGLAGVLIAAGGLAAAFALNGLSFGVIALVLIVSRPARVAGDAPSTAPPTPPRRAITWTALVRRIAGPLALDGAISVASASMSVTLVFVAVDALGGDESLTGLLNVGGGLGGIVGGIVAGTVVPGRARATVASAVAVCAAAMVVLGVVSIPILAFAATMAAVGSMTTLDTLNTTALQRMTDDGTTGRAFGILHALAAIWMMAGVGLSSLLLATLGIQMAILSIGAVVLALGGIAAVIPTRVAEAPLPEPAGLAPATA